MRMLIIGCGYIGARVARLWRGQGHSVHVLTRSTEHADTFAARGLSPIIGDVVDPRSLKPLQQLAAIDCVLYAVGFDRHSGDEKRTVYVTGLANVLEHIAEHTQRIVYVSSTSVYGESHGEWVDEETPCDPSTPGGAICRDAEQTLWSFCSQGDQSPDDRSRPAARILRMAGLYGPGRMLRRISAVHSAEPLGGSGDGYLNLIHGDDAAAAIVACAAEWPPGPVYNVTDGCPLTRREYYGVLAELLGAPSPVFTGQEDSARHRNTGSNKRVSSARIRRELPEWQPRYPHARAGLEQALSSNG